MCNRSSIGASLGGFALAMLMLLGPGAAARGLLESAPAWGRTEPPQETESIKVGERFTYTVSVDNFVNAGFVDLHVLSEGKYKGIEAFEVRMKVRTYEVVSAVFFSVDETRTAYISKASGLPITVTQEMDPGGFPTESSTEYRDRAPMGLDLVSLVFKARQAGGQGKFRLSENGQNYWLTLKPGAERPIRTEAGDFKVLVSEVQSGYFKEIGISDVKVFLTADAARIPVVVEFGTKFGKVSARLTGLRPAEKGTAAQEALPMPSPSPVPSPAPPSAKPTPAPYVDNVSLGPGSPFDLGEKILCRVKKGGTEIGAVEFEVRERKRFNGKDSVRFVSVVTESAPNAGIFVKGNRAEVLADPASFLPASSEMKFDGALSLLAQIVSFDQAAGSAVLGSGVTVPVSVGTHSLLSLLYSIRTFNLRRSAVASNPVNDTRVSVFWKNAAAVFTVRPAAVQSLSLNGSSVQVQPVDILTGDAEADALKIRVWLTDDALRVPVKISAGSYSAECALRATPPRS